MIIAGSIYRPKNAISLVEITIDTEACEMLIVYPQVQIVKTTKHDNLIMLSEQLRDEVGFKDALEFLDDNNLDLSLPRELYRLGMKD